MKQKLLLILALFFIINTSIGQDITPLITKARNTKDGKEQLHAYITLIDTLIWNEQQLDKCKIFIDEARQLASKYGTKNDKLHIDLLAFRRNFYTSEGDVLKWIEENEATYLNLKSPLLKAKYHLFAGIVRENKGVVGLPDFTQAQKIYEEEQAKGNYDKYLLDTYHRLTIFYRYCQKIDTSIYFLHQGMKLCQELNEPTSKIWFTLEQLEHYQSQAKFSEGIQLCLEWLNGKQGKLSFLNEITFRETLTIFYLNNLELDNAISNGEQLIKDIKKRGITNRIQRKVIANTYLKMSIASIKKSKYQNALELLDKAFLYQDDLSKKLLKNEANILKIQAYTGLKEYEQAQNLLDLHISSLGILYGNYTTSNLLISISFQLYAETDFNPSLRTKQILSQEILYILNNSKDYNSEIILNTYKLKTLLTIIKSGNQQLKEDFLETFKINEELNNTRNAKTTKNLLIQYQTKEKEQQIELQKLELAQKNTQRNLLIGFFVIVILIGLVVVWYLQNRAKILEQDLKNKERIAAQAEELERLYEQKNRLFNNIAHELRTPLTLIYAPIQSIFKKTKHLPSIQPDLATAKRNIQYLQRMVNQILDLSKVQTGQFSIHITKFKLEDLFNILKNDFTPLAQYNEVDFQFVLPKNDEIELITDGDKVFTVLKNLLSNAFKYTPPKGKIRIVVIDLGEKVQITVEDNGQGISATDLPRIFDYYFQTQDKDKLLEGGTGIGLAICKEYIKAIKGNIQANSELGKGTAFILTIPKAIDTENSATSDIPTFLQYQNAASISFSKEQKTKNNAAPNQPHLLIVEDNLEIANYLDTILKDDYHLTFKNNGKEALAALETIQPDLVITDLMMPVMNGYELIEALKASEQWQKIPIITLTALGEMAHKIKALRIGVDDYLVKPFDEEELALRIQNLLKNKVSREQFIQELADTHSDNSPAINDTNDFQHSAIDKEWLETLEATVKNRISDVNFNVNQLSVDLSTNTSQLYRKTKRLTGLSPKAYINQVRYTTARQMLENHTFDSVKRIAYEVGFKDEKNFSRNFKKRFGKYPSEYFNVSAGIF